ncbi:MAG TPA: ATP-dependent Clp protease adapter ClpS [Verrucomicrobiales bacterium]|nr:ATP-dependent Clp protease adapter ClpS [Verrucomicrobiales bacterium]
MAAPAQPKPQAPTRTQPATRTIEVLDRPWHVIVFNDPVNIMNFVTLVFQRVFGYPKEKAESLMLHIHRHGKSIVWSGARERAEFYVQQLQSHQLWASMEQSEP